MAQTDVTPQVVGAMNKPFLEKLKLLFVFALLALAIYFSHPTPLSFGIGFVIVLLGAWWRVWAGGHLTRNARLAVSGPYEYTRNPFYLGRFLFIVGFAVISGVGFDFSKTHNVILTVIFVVAMIGFFGVYMPRKDKREGGRLLEIFGEEYATYRKHVPALFPRLTPHRTNPRPWSKDLFLGRDETFGGNKEHWTTLAVLLFSALFLVRLLTQ